MTNVGKVYWDKWWVNNDFKLDCTNNEYDTNGKLIKRKRWEDDIKIALEQKAISDWKQGLTRIHAKFGTGGKKFRTYAVFKGHWGIEGYLSQIEVHRKRILLTKFRIGISPLRIETGRYEKGNKRIPPEERLCLCCDMKRIEDEVHFLVECPIYDTLRSKLFGIVNREFVVNEITAHLKDLFIKIMSSKSSTIITALSEFIWEAFLIREKVMYNTQRSSSSDVVVYIDEDE